MATGMTNTSAAMNAYKSALAHAQNAATGSDATTADGANTPAGSEGTFFNMVRGYASEAIDTNRKAEELSIKAIRGEADLSEVVTAVASAEAALRTVVTVRDRVIRAYEEIIRMPV